MCDYISSSLKKQKQKNKPSEGQLQAGEDPKHVNGDYSSAIKCVIVVLMILMLSETGPQADKMDPSNKRTFLLYSPIPQMANVTKIKLT